MARIHYTQGPGQWGQLISARNVDSGVSRFYGYDMQGNTTFLTDSAGNITDTYSYNAFGEELSSSGSTPNPHRYGGQVGYYRDKIERVYVRARHYAPPTGRWLSRDPIGFVGGDFNLYRYVRNNPVRQVDPWGLSPPDPIGIGPMGQFWYHYYFGRGATINLSDWGLLQTYKESSSVVAKINEFNKQLKSRARSVASQMFRKQCTCTTELISGHFTHKRGARTDVTWVPGLYNVGKSKLRREAVCTIVVECKPRTYSFACSNKFWIDDRFEDPVGLGIELGGTIYHIKAKFYNAFSGTGSF
jgi:RHS repeat-associated protein